MPVQHIEHVFVQTDDIEATRRFYCDALGFEVGFRPELDFPGYWLYAGGVPCIHVGERRAYERFTAERGLPFSEPAHGTGTLDHVAFTATSFGDVTARLEKAGIEYALNTLDDIGLRQIFLEDPNGVTIELNFRADPAA